MLTEKEFRVKLLQWNRTFRKLSSRLDNYMTADFRVTDFRGGAGKWLLLLAKVARAENEITEETVEQDILDLYSRGIVYNGICRIGEHVFLDLNCPAILQDYALLRTGHLDEFLKQSGAFKRNSTLKNAVSALKQYHPMYWCTCINKWDENQLKEAEVDRLDENALKMYEHVFFELQSKAWVKVEASLLGNKKSLQYLTKNYYDAIMDGWFLLTGEYGTGSTEEDFDRYAKIMWDIYQKVSKQ